MRALHGGPAVDGLDPAAVRRTADALVAKRLRALRRAWPALTHELGPELEPRFARYAHATAPPDGGAPADGLAFTRALVREGLRLSGESRVERALIRAAARRRAPLVTVVAAGPPRRYVMVLGLAGRRPRSLTVGGTPRR